MIDDNQLLSLILEKASAAEPVSIVRVVEPDGTTKPSVFWRGEFTPHLPAHLFGPVSQRLSETESRGGIADLFSVRDETGKEVLVVLEIVRPKVRLLVFGAGHVGQATALMGAMLGYNVVVVDDRQEFLSRKRFPDPRIELVVHEMDGAAVGRISPGTAVVIVTRGHQSDEACLKSVLRSAATYIGMIGSKRRVLGVFKKLSSEGFTETELGRVHAPIGLRIGARTPQEIAVSILAEVIDCVNNPKPEHNGGE
jgi:xanthine/CO dehydrogenase XdhC/CoxF family maturation factor